jgi:hypothetical protein
LGESVVASKLFGAIVGSDSGDGQFGIVSSGEPAAGGGNEPRTAFGIGCGDGLGTTFGIESKAAFEGTLTGAAFQAFGKFGNSVPVGNVWTPGVGGHTAARCVFAFGAGPT